MHREIVGNSYKYIVDESYGVNRDGFIAIGTESIVYKGLKTKADGNLQFSCVLKFKPKKQIIDGEEVDRLKVFKTEEWKIFEDLRECRSVVKIDDVVDDLGDFVLSCEHIDGGIINASSYFCVVEEFIDGWNLNEFCCEEYWKLRKYETLTNGLRVKKDFNDYSDDEKKAVKTSYSYDNQLKYQNQILLFMINFCEIMEFVTQQKNILHLDIKPENIMVTRYGKELVLIDFGRSKKVTIENKFTKIDLPEVDYNENEVQCRQYQYGTLGYAAPECYANATNGSKFPFDKVNLQGCLSIESDIFSFGATFWECLNIFELVTKTKQFSEDIHDFYRDNFLNDNLYCNRDLSLTNSVYHQKLEKIVKKCTKKRTKNMANSDKYYHSYKDLCNDIEIAKDSSPTIIKEENVKVKTAFKFSSVMASLLLVLIIINSIYHMQAYDMAVNRWNSITVNYNETQFSQLSVIAKDYISASPYDKIDDTYDKIVKFTYRNGGSISAYETTMIVNVLKQIDDNKKLSERVDEILKHANTGNFKEISSEIVGLGNVENSIGYELAKAIYNVEVSKTDIVDAYLTLQKYSDNFDFRNATIKLKNVLDNDDNIQIIVDGTKETRKDVLEFFNEIMK